MDLLTSDPNDRVIPRCPVFGRCGGCDLQHLSYAAQLRLKEKWLIEAFAKHGLDIRSVVLPICPAPSPWFYRQRVQLHASSSGAIGFHGKNSHNIVPIDHCAIAHPKLNEEITYLKAHPFRGRLELVWDEAKQLVKHYGEGAATQFFSQVNPEQNERLKQTLLDWILSPASVLELYAGAGNFTIPMARRGARVLAVESSPAALGVGIVQSRSLPITWIESGARAALKQVEREGRSFECVVLDPPRRGAKDCMDLLLRLSAPRIFYISCNPETLARDLSGLTPHYAIVRILPFDFFPQTLHVEALCELKKI